MAKQRLFMQDRNTWVGSYVYQAFKPLRLGRIKEILPLTRNVVGFERVRVAWEDGSESTPQIPALEKIEDLIGDHKRKLKKHEDNLARVQAMDL